MRIFNTSGACIPEKHYTVMREALIVQGEALVDQGRFFTIFAPRQTGKTTYFQLLFRHLQQSGYTPVRVSLEAMKTLGRAKFYQTLGQRLARGLSEQQIRLTFQMEDQIDFQTALETARWPVSRIVLVIDEFEEIAPEVLSEFLHVLRDIYQYKEHYVLHSLMLVGVSTLAELVVSSSSPFNIVDQLQIPYFTFAEVQGLIQQFVDESGQPFDEAVIRAIYTNTQGQPGLVNGLCQHLVDVVAPDRRQPISMDHFYPTLTYFLTEHDNKNILNIVQKAKMKRTFMSGLLFNNASISFTVYNPDISFLYANGVIDNLNGLVGVSVPLYRERLITALHPATQRKASPIR